MLNELTIWYHKKTIKRTDGVWPDTVVFSDLTFLIDLYLMIFDII